MEQYHKHITNIHKEKKQTQKITQATQGKCKRNQETQELKQRH